MPLQVAVDFRRRLPPPRDFWRFYARGSYQNAPRFGSQQYVTMPGRFLYRLASGLDTTELPNGPYRLSVTAIDERGNRGTLDRRFWVDNDSGLCVAPPAPATSAEPAGPSPSPQSPYARR